MVANFGVIGDGDIASVLPKDTDKLFFASGVSNSQEERESEYLREIQLLLKQHRTSHIVYFSSLAIFYSNTRYAQHKLYMERIVKDHFEKHCIIRIGNISWGTNPHTLINYLRAHPSAMIKDEYRYVIDEREFLHWIDLIPDWTVEMNCPGRMLKVNQIKQEYVDGHTGLPHK